MSQFDQTSLDHTSQGVLQQLLALPPIAHSLKHGDDPYFKSSFWQLYQLKLYYVCGNSTECMAMGGKIKCSSLQ